MAGSLHACLERRVLYLNRREWNQMITDLAQDLEERFLRYVQIDTESDETSTSIPSTQKQLALLEILAAELREMGAADVCITDYATVLATIPALIPTQKSLLLPFWVMWIRPQPFPERM